MFKIKISEHDPLNKESLKELGWEFMKDYKTDVDKELYTKDNYYMSIDYKTKICRFILRDPSLFDNVISDPENIRIILKIETIQQFKQLQNMLLWTSKSS